MAGKTMPTPGPWSWRSEDLRGGRYYTVTRHGADDPEPIDLHEDDNGETDARLIATAGTAAHEVAQMGYDPVEAVRALPYLLRTAAAMNADVGEMLEVRDACGDPGMECPMQDSGKPGSTEECHHALCKVLARAAGKEGDDGQ